MLKHLKDERGAVWLWTFYFSLPLLLLLMPIYFDLTRAEYTQGRLQNAADSGALAACLTATATPQISTNVTTDSNGNITGITQTVTGYITQIPDASLAQSQALAAFEKNTTGLVPSFGGFTSMEVFNPNTDFRGNIVGANSYEVDAVTRLKTFLLGTALQMYGINNGDELTVNVTGTATAHAEVQR